MLSIDALALPLTILSNCNPVTPLAGILYKPEPLPIYDPVKDPVTTASRIDTVWPLIPLIVLKDPVSPYILHFLFGPPNQWSLSESGNIEEDTSEFITILLMLLLPTPKYTSPLTYKSSVTILVKTFNEPVIVWSPLKWFEPVVA